MMKRGQGNGVYKVSALVDFIDDFCKISVASSSDGIMVLDPEGKVAMFNQSAMLLLACSHEELLGKKFPYKLIGKEPYEVKVVQRGRDAIFIAVRTAEFDFQHSRYRVFSMRDITARVRLREQLRSKSMLDELTGLHNRRGFLTLGEHALELSKRERSTLVLVFADLDGMKQINDTLGHKAGDAAVAEAAALLAKTFRKSDIIARLGGDEFAVIAHERTTKNISAIQRRLRANQADLNSQAGREYLLKLSVGFASYDPESPSCLDDLLERADLAMYEQKHLHRISGDSVIISSGR
ncbi:MAG: diguanylate cyclase [Candidatus Obscuribacterales bacterium]|nr:diguanylate cyclase [Candidatus Obscuribacterales bacterium]